MSNATPHQNKSLIYVEEGPSIADAVARPGSETSEWALTTKTQAKAAMAKYTTGGAAIVAQIVGMVGGADTTTGVIILAVFAGLSQLIEGALAGWYAYIRAKTKVAQAHVLSMQPGYAGPLVVATDEPQTESEADVEPGH